MSFDVIIARFPGGLSTFDELPDEWQPEDLGTVAAVRAAIGAAVPAIEWDATGWGSATGDGYSVEIALTGADDETLNSVLLMFRGGGDINPVAVTVAEHLSARPLGGSVFLDTPTDADPYADWQRYRDHVTGRDKQP